MFCPRCKTHISPTEEVDCCPQCGLDITKEKNFVQMSFTELWHSDIPQYQIFIIRFQMFLGLFFTAIQIPMTYVSPIGIVFWLICYIHAYVCLNRGLKLCQQFIEPTKSQNFKTLNFMYVTLMVSTFISAVTMLVIEIKEYGKIDLSAPADHIHSVEDLLSPELLNYPNTYCFLIMIVMFLLLIRTYSSLNKLLKDHLAKIYS